MEIKNQNNGTHIVAMPFKGDDCEQILLDKVAEKGLMPKERALALRKILSYEKEQGLMGSYENAWSRLVHYLHEGYKEFGIDRDSKRYGLPWRPVFKNYDTEISGVKVSFDGKPADLIPAALRSGMARI